MRRKQTRSTPRESSVVGFVDLAQRRRIPYKHAMTTCGSLCGTCLWCLGFIAGAAHHLHTLDTSDIAELVERWANSRGAHVFAMANNKYVPNIDVVRVRFGEELIDVQPKAALEVLIRGLKLPHTADEALAAIREVRI